MRLPRPLLLLLVLIAPCLRATAAPADATSHKLCSPDESLCIAVALSDSGRPHFTVRRDDTELVTGKLGLHIAGGEPLADGLEFVGAKRQSHDETYKIPVGKTSSARDHHNELVVSLRETREPHRRLDVALRAFDDGIAFRYLMPEQDGLADVTLLDELTQFTFAGDPTAQVLPLNKYTSSYERYYLEKPTTEITPKELVGLPMLLEHNVGGDADNNSDDANEERDDNANSIWIALTEAELTDYAGMYLAGVEGDPGALVSKISPLPDRDDGAKVLGRTPFQSPWRVLMIADDVGRLLESNIVFNLSSPSAIDDPSWIKPARTTFPWWNGYVLEGVDFEPGVNTATMKHYVDFCAEHGIECHSLDGLDIAWYDGPIRPKGPADVTTAAPSINMPELLRYAKEKGVRLRLWMHWKALADQLDEAFATYEKWGIEGVMIDFMDRDDQEMVAWYHEVAEKAAKHHLTVTWHGAYKPTGTERRWPNVLNYEAALNQEFNKWGDVGTPPEHNLKIAMVRGLAGSTDYHHGGMRNVLPKDYKPERYGPPVQGTRGHQLGLFVVYLNHMPMLADYPSAYRGQPGLEFMATVPTTWDETRVLHADFPHALVVARRSGKQWYIGGMAAGKAYQAELPLEFLGDGSFNSRAMFDDPANGPTALQERTERVTADDRLSVHMPESGGFVAVMTPKQ